jgi:ubiquinone biosynthesis protein Coq4
VLREPVINIQQLRSYAPGTFGRAVADALEQHSLRPFSFGRRRLQLHDAVHVLLGYGFDLIDEARLQAFLLGTKNRFKPINLAVLGLLASKIKRQLTLKGLNGASSGQILRKALWQSYQRGLKSSFNPDTWQPETMWHLPLEQVRKQFNVEKLLNN